MPNNKGIWSVEEALQYHDFSYRLAKFIGDFLPKDKTTIDWGCGRATLLRYLHDRGFQDLYGVEGERLPFFEFSRVIVHDITMPMIVNPNYNSICLEVGEHVPPEYTEVFIENITKNTKDTLILSWAIPGQDGIGHVNCKHNVEVIERLKNKGFYLDVPNTLEIRQHVDNHTAYFRDTLMVFRNEEHYL